MGILFFLIVLSLVLGVLWLAGFMWALHNNQMEDPEGAANRILFQDDEGARP